jgi:TRAP-type C4-dicarboxylate transport system permease small subunit
MSMRTIHAGGASAEASASGWLRTFERAVTYLANTAFAVATLLVLIDLLLLGASVTARYLLNSPLLWSDTIVALSLTGITMLAAPKVLLDRGHIEVDIVTAMAKGRLSLLIQLWSSVAVLAVALLLIFNGWSTAMFSKMIGLLTDGYLELPLWPLQLLLPLGGALLVPVVILQVWKTMLAWRQPAPPAEHSSPLVD